MQPRRADGAAPDLDEVLERCCANDRRALRELYDRHFEPVRRTARRLGTPPSELDDVTQEVFSRVFGKLQRFAGGNFEAWLHRICANVVNDQHRRRRVREGFRRLFGQRPEAVDASQDAELGQREAEAAVRQILERMRPKQREVLALFELEGLSGEEIAARVGCPVATVWTRLHHARKDFVRIGSKRGLLEEAA